MKKRYGVWCTVIGRKDEEGHWLGCATVEGPTAFSTRAAAEARAAHFRSKISNAEVRPHPDWVSPAVGKDTNPKDAIAGTKIPLWLCSAVAKAHWAVAQFAGLIKYGAWNWRKAGVRASVYASAGARHFDRWLNGEEYDPVDGTHHLGNAMACAAILLDARAAGKLNDDRPPRLDLTPTYAELEPILKRLVEKHGHLTPKHYTIADSEPAEPV